MPGVITATAKYYAGLGGRKRRRTSFSTAVGDDEEDGDAEAIDFEVSCDVYETFIVI